MESISDLAGNDLLRRAQGIVTLADEEQPGPDQVGPLTRLADGSVQKLEAITTQQAVLRDAFRIDTVRDFDQTKCFRLARG